MRGNIWHTRTKQNGELYQPSHASIPIAIRMNPGEINMGDNSLNDLTRHFETIDRQVLFIQPVAILPHQPEALFRWSSKITTDFYPVTAKGANLYSA